MKYKLIWIVFSLLCWAGCYDENPLSPSGRTEFKYSVPQGDHGYDNRIVEWNKKGGFYILYRFEPQDIYFNLYTWNGTQIDATVADEKYAGKQLELLEETFLDFYSDTALAAWMPMKLLLCRELKAYEYGGKTRDIAMFEGFDNIAFNYGNEQIEFLLADPERKIQFKTDVNKLLFKRVMDRGKIEVPESFAAFSVYGEQVDRTNMYQKGFLANAWDGHTPEDDLQDYIEAILSYSYEELNMETADGNYDPIGMLNPKKDTNGLIRKKYEEVIKYFRNVWQIDLQAMGNYLKQ